MVSCHFKKILQNRPQWPPKISKQERDPTHFLVLWQPNNINIFVQIIKRLFYVSQGIEELTQSQPHNIAKCPPAEGSILRSFLITLTVLLIQNTSVQKIHKERWSSSQEVEKHIPKWSPKYLKMASSRGGDAMKRFICWGNPKSNSKNICKKIDLKQLNAFQEKGKHKKIAIRKNG